MTLLIYSPRSRPHHPIQPLLYSQVQSLHLPTPLKKNMADENTRLLGHWDETRLVDWDGEADPKNPLNWSERRKWSHIASVALLTFLV